MRSKRPSWWRAALGALAVVVAVVALGVLLEHAVGSSGASGAPPTRISTGEHHKFDAGARRIPHSLKEQLLTRRRLGGRYGGTDFSNVGNLGHAVWIQLLIATAVVIVTASWRRLRFRRRRV